MIVTLLMLLHMIRAETENCTDSSFISTDRYLFDFTKIKSTDFWNESSDTIREQGMSKAVLTLQKTHLFQRAILFTLLNPQPNGAGFAGVNYHGAWDLSQVKYLSMFVRAQGGNNWYKVVLRHRNQNQEPYPTYEQTFEAPRSFGIVNLDLDLFGPFYRGKALNESEVGKLDKKQVSSIGIQMYGGVYLPYKQAGASSLEIDWIKAVE